MNKIYGKIDRVRASGFATLNLKMNSPHYQHHGKRFAVHSMGKPGIKCRVTLIIDEQLLDFTIEEIL